MGATQTTSTTSTTLQTVALDGVPLLASGNRAKPTLTLALSIEEPTVGAQYLSGVMSATSDDSYSAEQRYVGYFDADSCYQYNNHSDADYRRFDRSGAAQSHGCAGSGFSGNFMNWASSSAIDILRLGLTGGDRVVDQDGLTILQRAVLSTVRPERFWNGVNFPSKVLNSALAGEAVPDALKADYSGDIYIANCLNRIHFGTQAEGSCSAPGNNSNLGVAESRSTPVRIDDASAYRNYTVCAEEDAQCAFTGIKKVLYGTEGYSSWWLVYARDGITCSNSALGSSDWTPRRKICYISDDDGGWEPAGASHGTSVLSSDGYFYARVQVCEKTGDSLSDPRNTAYCQRYPSGHYKPTGQLQKYSDRMRVAVLSYLIDNSQTRYGGVLRTSMRFVGSRHFDQAGGELSERNPLLEWDSHSGIFKSNPDQATEGHSGAINYLNKFGRTGNEGQYKLYDPVAELYYEALRYLQGLTPTTQASSGMTAEMSQQFPVTTDWVDPHGDLSASQDYSCLRNHILVIGDQNASYDKHIPGNTGNTDQYDSARSAAPSANEANFADWTNQVGQLEGLGQLASSIFAPNSYFTARAGYFMAGMAYWANTQDIRGSPWSEASQHRPGMRVSTHVLDVNERGFSSSADMRHSSPFFLAAKYGGFSDHADSGDPHTSGNVWQKAEQPGEARTYYLASSAQQVLDGLAEIFASIATEAHSIAGSALSSTSLALDDTGYLYHAQFDASDWSGDLLAIPLTARAGSSAETSELLQGTALWSASEQLLNRSKARNIVVGNRERAQGAAVPFEWTAIESSLQDQLARSSPEASADELGEQRLLYLRGERDQEDSLFRARSSLLGDIINSGVVYAAAPSDSIIDNDYYSSNFYQTAQTRTPMLFVGANDGMLHAFDARTGDEVFAYIPSWVGPRLSWLTRSSYVADGHQSYVDATPVVAEAKLDDQWKSVLVAGTGAGGQGVYALDVSAPNAFSAEKVLWEFTEDDDPALGHVMSAPQILKLAITQGQSQSYQWFAAVAGGVNNYLDDGQFSASAQPALFLLDLAHDGSSPWVEGRDYYKIRLPLAADQDLASGLTGFTVQLGSQGETRMLYAADLHGQLWRLDFSAQALPELPSGNQLPLFIASASDGKRQPISVAPRLLRAGNNETIVAFGSGKYLEAKDSSDGQTQTFYALLDAQDQNEDGDSGSIIGRDRLTQATADSDGSLQAQDFRWGRQAQWNASQQIHAGWFFDFPDYSERQVSNAVLYGSQLLFSSLIPITDARDACTGGSANSYQVDLGQGRAIYTASNTGLRASPSVLDLGEASYSARDSVGQRTKTVYARAIETGSTGISLDSTLQQSVRVGRLSWRHIVNYQQLHQQAQP
jgi:type IV pilus assembly protein PilY1